MTTIGIDGNLGVGKSTLAGALRDALGTKVIRLDDLVAKNRGSYLPSLDVARLRQTLEASAGPVVVEGVCLLAALEAVSRRPDVLIYVRQLSASGRWDDEETCDPEEEPDALIARLVEEVSPFLPIGATPGIGAVREEVIRYHARYRPLQRADVLLSLTEPDE